MTAAATLTLLAPHAPACDPLTSATCIAKVAAGAAAGGVAAGPGGAAAGAAAASGGAGAAARAAGGAVASAGVNALASAIQGAIGVIAKDTVAWWVNIPSPDLAADPVPRLIQQWLFPFTVAVALTGFIVCGARMALTRKAAPLADLGTGLLAIAATSAAATLLPGLLLRAGDAFSSYVLTASTGGNFAKRFTDLLALTTTTTASPAPAGLVIVLGIFAIIIGVVQAVLLLFRMGAVVLLTGTLPLAAAGQLTPLTRPWLKRQAGWMLALIFYKPAAALVYASGFALMGDGNTPQDLVMGFAVLALSLIALPALMKFFTWTTGQAESGGGGLMGSVIGAAAAVGSVRGYGGMSAPGQARSLLDSLGRSSGGSGTASGPGGPSGGKAPGPGPGAGSGSAGPGGGPGASPSGETAAGPGAGAGTGAGAGAGQPSGSAAAGTRAGGAAAAGSAAAGAAGPAAGVIMIGQAAKAAGRRLADGATTPPDGGRR